MRIGSEPPPALSVQLAVELENRRIAAMGQTDVATLAQLIDVDCLYVHSTGMVQTGRSYLEAFGSAAFGYESIEVEDRQTRIVGPIAVVVYRQIASVRIGGDLRQSVSRCTATWVARRAGVRLLSFQATPVRSDPVDK